MHSATPIWHGLNPITRATGQPPIRSNTILYYSLFTPHTSRIADGQLIFDGWQALTQNYLEPSLITAILGKLEFGARIGYEGQRKLVRFYPNLGTVGADPDIVTADIKLEYEKGRLELFTNETSLRDYYTAFPLGLTDKADGSKCQIYHLSNPSSDPSSINCGIP